jgi:hypothetical protein
VRRNEKENLLTQMAGKNQPFGGTFAIHTNQHTDQKLQKSYQTQIFPRQTMGRKTYGQTEAQPTNSRLVSGEG